MTRSRSRLFHALVAGLGLLPVLTLAAPAAGQTWIPLAPTGGPPATINYQPTAVRDPTTGRVILYGRNLSSVSQVWVLSSANGLGAAPTWTQLAPIGGPPPNRGNHAAVYDSTTNRMVIFGGCGGGCFPVLNDVWVLTNANGLGGTPQWIQLSPSGGPPVARHSVAAGYDPASNRMIIFGGHTGGGSGGTTYSDTWVLSDANGLGATPVWTQLAPTGGPPPGQYNPSYAYDAGNNRLIVVGGAAQGSGAATNAAWVLSHANGLGGTPAWTNLVPEGAAGSPPAFGSAAAFYDATHNRLTLALASGTDVALWTLAGANGFGGPASWTQLAPTGGPPLGGAGPSTAVYDPMSNRATILFSTATDIQTWVLTGANGLPGTMFLYANNDIAGASTVSGYSVGADGSLTTLPGSPFATGGTGNGGGLFAANRITVRVVNGILYASNGGSHDVSAFQIDPATGALTAVPGSPFATGGTGDISLAETPDGRFLMAGNSGSGNITVFAIAADGALTATGIFPVPAGIQPDGMKVSPNGAFLAVASPNGPGYIAMFTIGIDGSLTDVPGSPFADSGAGVAAGVEFNKWSDLLFVGEANAGTTVVDVFSVAANGGLTPIAGSPFVPGVGNNSNVVALSPDDRFLFVTNQFSDSVTVFSVDASGALTLVAGSPFAVNSAGGQPSGMAVDPGGKFLYTANFPNSIGGFQINADGSLGLLPGFSIGTGQPTGLLSLALASFGTSTGTTTALISSANPSVAGQTVTFTATVTSGGGGTPTGTVTFKDGAVTLGTGALDATGQATFATSALAVGPHSITAQYGGDASFAASASAALAQTVAQAATTTTVTANPNPSAFGQGVSFTAAVLAVAPGSGTRTGTVTFKDGAVTVGTGTLDATGHATFATSALAVGPHSITAEYGGDGSFAGSTSAILTQTVMQALTTTTVTANPNPSVFGQGVTFTATVAAALGGGTPTGTVTFKDGESTLGTGPLDATGHATLSTSTLAVGAHSITAEYGGGGGFTASTSSPALIQTVNTRSTTTSVVLELTTDKVGQPRMFTVTVTDTAGVGGPFTPSGTVTLTSSVASDVFSGPCTLDQGGNPVGTASCSVTVFPAAPAGPHTMTASFAVTSIHSASTGNAVLSVEKNPTATTLASSSNPSALDAPVTFTATASIFGLLSPTPSGSVQFFDGPTPLGTAALSATAPFTASVTTSGLSSGTHSITAVYSGDEAFDGSTSGVLSQEVKASVSGTVRDTSGNPLAGAFVDFLNPTLPPTSPPVATSVTAADGSYSSESGLPPGTYLVRVRRTGSIVAFFTAPGSGLRGLDFTTASPVTLTSGANLPYIDVTLRPGGTITVNVFEADGTTPLDGASVFLGRVAGAIFSSQFSTPTTNPSGQLTIGGLEDGEYTVRVQAPGHIVAFWSGDPAHPAADGGVAKPITITNASTQNVSINMSTGGTTISGQVTRSGGGAVPANTVVQILNGGGSLFPEAGFITQTNTDTSGNYSVGGVGPGSYIVQALGFQALNGTGEGWYPAGATSAGSAVPVPVGTSPVFGINFSVPSFTGSAFPGSISGTVTDADSQPISFGVVQALEPFSQFPIRSVVVNGNGTYTIPGLGPGPYIVKAFTERTYENRFSGGPLPNQLYPNAARQFTVGPTTTTTPLTGIDFALPATAATISGTVTSGGQGVEAVFVQARNFFDNNIQSTRSFRDGTYLIRGVPAGSSCSDVVTCNIKIRATGAAGLATRYYPAANGFDSGAFIQVAASQQLTGFDLTLLPSNGGVSGTPTTQGPSPLPVVGGSVRARDAVTGETANFAVINAHGEWSNPDLRSGSYRLQIAGPGIVTQWSFDKPTREAADTITITTGQLPPVAFSVATNPSRITGFVRRSDSTPLAGAGIIVCDGATGGFVTAGGVTDSSGAYSIEGLAAGTYVLQARAPGHARRNLAGPGGLSTTPSCIPYPSQTVVTYGNALGVRAAGTVNVAAGATVPVADITLTRSSDITGTVHYTGTLTGTLHVGLFLDAALTQQAYDFTPSPQAFPQSYGFTNAAPDKKGILPGTYYVAAWIDSNGNGARDSGERFGAIAAAVTVAENATIGAQDITLTDVADLLITKSGPSSAVYLDQISYTITVTNNGLVTATGVTVTDELPAALAFVSATVSQGSCTALAETVTCNLGGLASGASATVTLSVVVAAAGSVTNTASVTSSLSDPNTGNNSSSATLTVQQAGQTITVTTHAPATATTYNTSFTVAATASSGLGVSIAASGACSGGGTGSALVTMTSGTGTCTVTYDQAGNANYSAAAQVTESTTALQAGQTITVTTHAPAIATYNTSFTVAATASSALPVNIMTSGACSGGDTGSALVMMTSGTGTCTVKYDQPGNANYSAAPQVTETTTAQLEATTTSVTASTGSSTFGDAVTFTATIAAVQGTPTGSVQFQDNGVNLGDPIALPASGTVSLTASARHTGPNTISAVYSGDSNFSGSTGSVLQTVNRLDTSTVVTTSGSPSYTGQSVTFAATVTPANAAVTATGTVQFTDSLGASLGGPVPVVDGTASVTTAALTAGTHTITANFSGDDFNASTGSVTQTVTSTATFENATTADSTVSPPTTSAGYTPTQPPVVTGSVTFDPLATSYNVVLNDFNFIPTVIDAQGNRIISDRVPESGIVILTDDTLTTSSLTPVTTTAVTFTADINLADWFTVLPTGQIQVELNYVNFLTYPPDLASDPANPPSVWAGTTSAGTVTIPVGPTCTGGGNAGGTGCPFATKVAARLHAIDLGAGKPSADRPLESVQVRVFDRNSVAFQTVAGSKNPNGSRYGAIFEADAGRVGACVTDTTGVCFAGSQTSGDFLVIAKYFDPATNKRVYVGRPESPSDFVGGVASKEIQVIKVLRHGVFQEYRGGSKTTFSGSVLEVISPDSGVWTGTQSLYPFIFTSDSTWSVDVCAQVPSGNVIVGVYDETGAFLTSRACAQALVANQTRVIVFEVHDIGSPELTLDATLKVVDPKGKKTVHKVKVEDVRRHSLDADVAKVRADRRQRQGAAGHHH